MIGQWDVELSPPFNNGQEEEEAIVTFGCFGDTMICVVDMTMNGLHIRLDGDYQRMANMEKNEHTIWRKLGKPGLWRDIYMFWILMFLHLVTSMDNCYRL